MMILAIGIVANKDDNKYNYENFISYSPTLREHLLFQLNVSRVDDEDMPLER